VKRLAILPIAMSMSIAMAIGGAAEPDSWAALRIMVGKWEGSAAGVPGKGRSTREFRFEMNERFLSEHGKILWEPKSAAEKAAVHEDFGWFSYDSNLMKIVWRQFHDEGFVNEYTLDSASADGKSLDFVSVRIENIAPGWRAKESFRMLSADEMEATFWLAAPGKDFEVYVRSQLKRVK
jgi:hypothetical protein